MKTLLTIAFSIIMIFKGYPQSISINNDASAPHTSAMLDVSSNSKGFLAPRMFLAERNLIASPATGLLIYQKDNTPGYYYYNGAAWIPLASGSASNYWSLSGNNIFNNNAGNVGIGVANPSYRLDVFSNNVQANTNTHLLKLTGQNPLMSFSNGVTDFGYIKAWSYQPSAPYTNGMVIGSSPGYPIYLSTNFYTPTMTVADNGNVGIGTTTPDYKLNISSTVPLGNSNTALLKLTGQNPIMVFSNGVTDFGYIKAWSYQATAPFTNGLVIGSSPGYPIFLSTNGYSATMTIADNGNVGIGTTMPTYKLAVNGNIRSKEVVVETGWADYVFDNGYKLRSLAEVERFIREHKHLPGIPSAREIETNGLQLGNTQKKMMEKIEELTLYVIQLQKEIEELKTGKYEK